MVEFQVADAQKLPFKDNTFDVVLSESVILMVKDKKKALKEYMRVLKPGGYIGFNEVTWIKKSPPKHILEFLPRVFNVTEEVPGFEDWIKLVKEAGFKELVAKLFRVKLLNEGINRIRRWGLDYFRLMGRFIVISITDPTFKKTMRKVWKGTKKIPKEIFKYFGYGLYVARK